MINPHKQFLAVKTPSDEYSVIEVLEMETPELGDVLSGELESLGGETLINLTKEESIDVFIQEIYATKEQALRLLQAP
ncbi:hypothetical protein [Paenibacillus solani]|uniref:hypothetical protein n=1 Tax=Paenibacillus solani TaxID=1705565 RepID=UPI003D2C77B1